MLRPDFDTCYRDFVIFLKVSTPSVKFLYMNYNVQCFAFTHLIVQGDEETHQIDEEKTKVQSTIVIARESLTVPRHPLEIGEETHQRDREIGAETMREREGETEMVS